MGVYVSGVYGLIDGFVIDACDTGRAYSEAVKMGIRPPKVSERYATNVAPTMLSRINSAAREHPEAKPNFDALNAHLAGNIRSYVQHAYDAWQEIEKARRDGCGIKVAAGAIIGGLIGAGICFAANFQEANSFSAQLFNYAVLTITGAIVGCGFGVMSSLNSKKVGKLKEELFSREKRFLDDAVRAFVNAKGVV